LIELAVREAVPTALSAEGLLELIDTPQAEARPDVPVIESDPEDAGSII